MPLSYHLIDYALLGIVLALAHLVHPLFYLLFVLLLFLIVKQHRFEAVVMLMIITVVMSRPQSEVHMPSRITGRVIKMTHNAVILKTEYGLIKACSDESFSYGDEIDCQISLLEMKTPDNTYGFNETHYLLSNSIIKKVSIEKVYQVIPHWHFANVLESLMSDESTIRSYQRLFLLGIRDEEMTEDYGVMSSLSIVHLFALSGMHVSLLYALIMHLTALIMTRQTSSVFAKILIGIYVFLIPYNVSLHRAFWMMVLVPLLEQHYNALDALSGLALINVLYNPYIIFNTSFIFSYLTYLMVLFTRGCHHQSLLVYLSTIPVLLCTNASINLLSFLLINLLEPYITLFYLSTIMSVVMPWTTPLLKSVVFLFEKILLFTNAISQTLIFSHPSIMFIGLFYLFYGQMLLHMELKQSCRKEVLKLISLMLAFSVYSRYKIYDSVMMINVGQGDCTLIRLNMNRYNILIDTGGNRNYDLATTTLIPYLKAIGVDHLDAVYISHYDYDHYGALESLQSHFRVNKIYDSPQPKLNIGPLTIENLTTGKTYDSTNGNSKILYVTLHQVHYLFTGDMETEVEEDLYAKYGQLHVDILKVAHHGSSGSSSVTLFEMVHPKIAMIGVGKNNTYGHPSQIVLDRLNSRHIMVLRTDEDGDFTIRHYGNRYYIFR